MFLALQVVVRPGPQAYEVQQVAVVEAQNDKALGLIGEWITQRGRYSVTRSQHGQLTFTEPTETQILTGDLSQQGLAAHWHSRILRF